MSGPYDHSNLGFFGDAKNAPDDADFYDDDYLEDFVDGDDDEALVEDDEQPPVPPPPVLGEVVSLSSRRPRFRQTTVGALLAAAAKEELGADVAVINGATIKVRTI